MPPESPAFGVVRGTARRGDRPESPLDRIVAQINAEFALVVVGNGYAVLQELPPEADAGPFRLLTLDAFKERFRPHRVQRGEQWVTWATAWLGHQDRRTYERITFVPGAPREVGPVSHRSYNLWRGWGVDPDPAPHPERRCARFLAHLRDNVADGDPALARWIVAWLAALVQRPADKVGTALVLQGGQGTGKTVVHRAMAALLGPHAKLVSSIERVTGRFNGHLADTLLLTLDEATWGGDHHAAGRLKDLVTGADHVIEYKGREPVRVANHTRLLVTSNNGWVVPAGLDERRFAVVRVGQARQQDASYFRPLFDELAGGGPAALLAYLLAFDLAAPDAPDPRQVPTTGALIEQQLASLPSDAAWWRDVLERGVLPGDTDGSGVTRASALHAAYVAHARDAGAPRRASETQIGCYLRRVAPGIDKRRVSLARPDGASERTYVYALPPLAVCRAAFAEQHGRHAVDAAAQWSDPDAQWAGDVPSPGIRP